MYQRAVIREFGEASAVIELEPYTPGPLPDSHVRIGMTARSINPSDLIAISGAYRSRIALPFLPGFEGVGVVAEAGAAVHGLHKGSRVLPIGSAGAWQDVKDCDAQWCLNVPDELSNEQAAMSYVNPMTAWVMLHDIVRIDSGMRIAITAASSSIGRMLVKMANIAGVTPVAFVRSEHSASLLAGMSATTIVCGSIDPYSSAMDMPDSSGLADVVLDCIGGREALALAKLLRPGGRFIHYGLLSGASIPSALWTMRPDIRFTIFHLRNWAREVPLFHIHRTYERVSALIAQGVIGSRVRNSYSLDSVREALIDAKNISSTGKVLIVP